MAMKTSQIKKCGIDFFGSEDRSFWMGKLENILLDYPELEYECSWEVYCLIHIEKADGLIIVDDVQVRADEPKMVVIKPNQVTLFDLPRKAKGTLICFKEDFFTLRYNNNVLYAFSFIKQGLKPFQRITDSANHKIKAIIEFMWEENAATTHHRAKILRSYLNILLFEVQKLFAKSSADQEIVRIDEKMITFEKLLNQQFTESRSPSHYAHQLFISENYLNRLCKQYKNKTAGELIRERVSIEAQRLLLHAQLSVAEIGLKLGFESASYFATFFKKQIHESPEEFRQRYK